MGYAVRRGRMKGTEGKKSLKKEKGMSKRNSAGLSD
jgi:hypothetical protein